MYVCVCVCEISPKIFPISLFEITSLYEWDFPNKIVCLSSAAFGVMASLLPFPSFQFIIVFIFTFNFPRKDQRKERQKEKNNRDMVTKAREGKERKRKEEARGEEGGHNGVIAMSAGL